MTMFRSRRVITSLALPDILRTRTGLMNCWMILPGGLSLWFGISIGTDMDLQLRLGKDNISIPVNTVAFRLGNYSEIKVVPGAAFESTHLDHPYRFVFIDSCDAGKNAAWAKAFGIPGREMRYDDIKDHAERAQAFLGWRKSVAAAQDEQEAQFYQNTLALFFTLWMTDEFSLKECVEACDDFGHPGQPYEKTMKIYIDFPLGAWRRNDVSGSGAETLDVFPLATTRYYGYSGITRRGVKP